MFEVDVWAIRRRAEGPDGICLTFRRPRGGRTPSQDASQEASARLAFQPHVAHQPGAAAPALQNDLAVMEGFELGTVADAYQRCLARLPAQQLHQLVLASRVERRSGLVEHDDV